VLVCSVIGPGVGVCSACDAGRGVERVVARVPERRAGRAAVTVPGGGLLLQYANRCAAAAAGRSGTRT